MNWGNLLFGFQGRINRAKWWLTVLVVFILNIVINVLGAITGSDTLAVILSLVFLVLYVWISLAAGTKRLHDLGRAEPGLWCFSARRWC